MGFILTAALSIPKSELSQTRDVGLFTGISHLEWLVRSLQAGHGVTVSKGNPVFSLLVQFSCLYENRSGKAGFNKGKGLPANGLNHAENPINLSKSADMQKDALSKLISLSDDLGIWEAQASSQLDTGLGL